LYFVESDERASCEAFSRETMADTAASGQIKDLELCTEKFGVGDEGKKPNSYHPIRK